MLKLKPFEVCKYSLDCPHKNGCYGLKKDRENEFVCSFIYFENGKPCFPDSNEFKKSEFNMSGTNKKILHG
ncbi:MAG: hypothetical protein ACOC1K_04035 [Nanoarchaeota archaeon]